MAYSRVRVHSLGEQIGFDTYLPSNTETTHTYSLGYARCEDSVGDHSSPYPLYIEKYSISQLGTVSGRAPSFPVYDLRGVAIDGQSFASHLDLSAGRPSDTQTYVDMLAKTNPSRPDVDIPVDLIDAAVAAPETLRSKFEQMSLDHELSLVGSLLKKKKPHHGKLDSSVVEYNFGWDLLYQDLRRIVDFAAATSQRYSELKALHKARGLARSSRLHPLWSSSSETQSGPFTAWSLENGDVEVINHRYSSSQQWASSKWLADPGGSLPTDAELLQQARFVVHGWNASPSTFWEAVPWSWLIDYFVNVGDVLAATRNAVGAYPTNGCIMRRQVTTSKQEVTAHSSWLQVIPAVAQFTTKERWLHDEVQFGFWTVPFIGTKQLVTMADIALGRSPSSRR